MRQRFDIVKKMHDEKVERRKETRRQDVLQNEVRRRLVAEPRPKLGDQFFLSLKEMFCHCLGRFRA